MIFLIIIYIVLLAIVTNIGASRQIGGVAAFFIGLLLSPLIGFIVVAVSPKKEESPKTIAITKEGKFFEVSTRLLKEGNLYMKKDPMGEAYTVYKKHKNTDDEIVKEFPDYLTCKNYLRDALNN